MKSLSCAPILPVTMVSDIARIGYATRRQDILSSLPQRYRCTLVQPWGSSVAPFQVADETVGTSISRPSIRELPQAEVAGDHRRYCHVPQTTEWVLVNIGPVAEHIMSSWTADFEYSGGVRSLKSRRPSCYIQAMCHIYLLEVVPIP
jgi:hypothetical protein